MKNPIQLPKPIRPIRKSLNRSPWRRGLLLIPLALGLASLAVSPPTAAGCDEICDGDLGGNTAFGFAVLYNLTTGQGNSAFGSKTLTAVTTGNVNTVVGAFAMANTELVSDNNTVVGGHAMENSFDCSDNTVIGAYAMGWHDENFSGRNYGSYNTATGYEVLY